MRQLPVILLAAGAPAAPELRVTATLEPAFRVAAVREVALDAAPGADIVCIGARGEVRTWAWIGGSLAGPRGTLVLADPARSAFAFAPLAQGGPAHLFLAGPRGVAVHRAGDDGGFGPEPVAQALRARLALRTGVPVEAPLAQDVDGDGRTDLVVPAAGTLELWSQRPPEPDAGEVRFARAAAVQVPIASSRSTDNEALSDELTSAFTIPTLRREDLNGDGRLDLVVHDGQRRAFHLLRADGAIPREPDVVLDLAIFRDTTPGAEIVPGRTLAGLDRALYERVDLDADGIPDHVIAHRRKVWVFRGSTAGPRFETPSSVLKTADDVTALALLDLDADGRADLVLVRIQVPTVATLLRGLVGEWEVEITAAAYRAAGERDFEATPTWRSDLRLRVPAILSILRDPDAILQRFEGAGRKLRANIEGDFDGDGHADIALVSEDGARLEVWMGAAGTRAAEETPAALVRRVLFDDPDKTWDVDRLVAWLSGWAELRVKERTGGRPPAAALALRPREEWNLVEMSCADLAGDGRARLVLRYDAPDGTRSVVDVVERVR